MSCCFVFTYITECFAILPFGINITDEILDLFDQYNYAFIY